MQGRRSSSSTVTVSCAAESGEEKDLSISSDDELSPIPKPKPKPGAITPLGIRHDKSKGPLGHQTASSTIEEMDTALARLDSWRSRHEHQMAALRREGLNRMEDNRPSTPELGSMDPAEWSLERPRSAAPRIVADDPSTSTPSPIAAQLGSLNPPILTERPSTAMPSSSRPSSSSSRSTRLGQDELHLLRHSMTLDFRSPIRSSSSSSSTRTSLQSLSSRPSTSSGASTRTAAQRLSRPATSSGERTSRMNQPRPLMEPEDLAQRQHEATKADDAISSEEPAGSRLMAELEAELAEMDRGLEENELMTWESELEEVLAKMDTLQTGYQVAHQAPSTKRQ